MPEKRKSTKSGGTRPDLPAEAMTLNKYELVLVQELLKGSNVIKAHEVLKQKFPDDPAVHVTTRAMQHWVHRPHVKKALEAGTTEQVRAVQEYQRERTTSLLPKFTDDMLGILDEGTDAWKIGFQKMREILESDESSDRSKIECFGKLTVAVKEVVTMAGILQKETISSSAEKVNSQQGLTPEFGQFLREQFLGSQTIAPPPQQIEAGEGEAIAPEQIEVEPVEVEVEADEF